MEVMFKIFNFQLAATLSVATNKAHENQGIKKGILVFRDKIEFLSVKYKTTCNKNFYIFQTVKEHLKIGNLESQINHLKF